MNHIIIVCLNCESIVSEQIEVSSSRKPSEKDVQKIVDLANSWDRIYIRDNEILLAQVCERANLSKHKKHIEQNFPIILNVSNMKAVIPLWRKFPHGKVERFEFDIVSWEYSPSLKKMVLAERQERL